MIQSESLSEIRAYLIYLNNEHLTMRMIKEKESNNKVRTTKQVIFAEKLSKTIFYKSIKVTKSVNHLKQHDVTLTSVKDTDLQTNNYFLCHKSDHIIKEFLNQLLRINALNDEEFNRSFSELNSDSKN